MAEWKAGANVPQLATGQREMFPLTLTGILPDQPNGEHLEFVAEVGDNRFYCKRDKDGRPIRATEWFATSLAQHLNIPVPDFAPIRNPENNEILFGSKGTWGTASSVEVRTFLTTPQIHDKAIGGDLPWLPSYLSRLYAFDLFIANPDSRDDRTKFVVDMSSLAEPSEPQKRASFGPVIASNRKNLN